MPTAAAARPANATPSVAAETAEAAPPVLPAADDQPPARRPFRKGEICPVCGLGVLDYNGLIDLECPVCGITEGPGGGCT